MASCILQELSTPSLESIELHSSDFNESESQSKSDQVSKLDLFGNSIPVSRIDEFRDKG